MLRCLLPEQRAPASDWTVWLPCVVLGINSAPADATGKSPHELVYGEPLSLPIDRALQHAAPNLAAQDLAARVADLTARARDSVAKAAQFAAKYANHSRHDASLGVGERVLLATRNLRLIGSPKFR